MLKKLGIPLLVLLGMLMLFPQPRASAAVRFGVWVGPPARAYPVYPAYPDPYAYPYSDSNAYPAYPNYYAAPPVYAYPYGGGYAWRGHREHEWREHRGHAREGRGYWRGGYGHDRR